MGFGIFHFAPLFGFGVGLATFHFQNRFAGGDVLLGDAHFFLIIKIIGQHMLFRGHVGDFANALGVKNIVRVKHRQRRLFEKVNRGVFQHIAIEVRTDEFNDIVAEGIALLIQFLKLQLLTHGFQSFRKLGAEQFFHRRLVGSTCAANGLRHFEHVFFGFVDADEKRHFDVGANIVFTNQSLVAAPVDFDGLERDVHDFGAVNHR